MWNWLRDRRRRRLRAAPWPDAWEQTLQRRVWQIRGMPNPLADRLRDCVRVLVAEKHWTGCNGLEVTDEVRVTIAGQAALATLGPDEPYYFDRLMSVLVYPRSFVNRVADPRRLILESLRDEEEAAPEARSGEAWRGGPIILSWEDIRTEPRSSCLVLHEVAHHLDGLDGAMDGAPPGLGRDGGRRLLALDEEYARFQRDVSRRRPTLLDPYGATSPAEFFAVATEAFFTVPHPLRAQWPRLYEALTGFYQQSPADWLARDASG